MQNNGLNLQSDTEFLHHSYVSINLIIYMTNYICYGSTFRFTFILHINPLSLVLENQCSIILFNNSLILNVSLDTNDR